ncbi:MAG: hypothetical protein E2O38_11270 [Proteobacteria bacterium]|nr:MAG: hypothetical protein E2O38_11270 [Pseudomonadota bacterium]
MQQFRRFARPISPLVVLCLLGLGLSTYLPVGHAVIISTEAVVNAEQAQQQRDHVRDLLNRNDVKAYLSARGVDPANVQVRVDSLTDAEVDTLASRLDQHPAGGDFLGGGFLEVALIAFIVLLITDILGYTDIFPFVNKKAK